MDFSIRFAREADAASMVALLNPIIQAGVYTVMDEPVTLDGQIEYIRQFPQHGIFLVAVRDDGGEVLGMQDVIPMSKGSKVFRHVGEISTFVALEVRGQGIGRRLCQATFGEAKRRGFRKLSAAIRADNPRAVAFYRGQGFRRVGVAREHAFIGGKYVDEVLMERKVE